MSKRQSNQAVSPAAPRPQGVTRPPDLTRGLGNAGMLERLRSKSADTATSDAPAEAPAERTPAEVVEAFYAAFARRDGAAMGALYHPEASFSDPVFGSLRGAQIGAMWTMLCESAPDLVVTPSGVKAGAAAEGAATPVTAHWDATYTFPATRMPVRNSVDARLEVRDGKIVSHVDDFDFYRWSRQALGVVGWLFGWTSFFKNRMTAASRAQLESWQEQRRSGEPQQP